MTFDSFTQRPLPIVIAIICSLIIGILIPRPGFINNNNTTDKITVNFYGESLCPDCQHFVLHILTPIFESGLSKYINLRYIAWGNAKGNPPKDVTCQHGPVECNYDRYINCAQDIAGNEQDIWFPYIKCLAINMREIETSADQCASDNGFDPKEIATCASNSVGEKLEVSSSKETASLVPKHQFVPWAVINGIALGGDFENIDRYICALLSEGDRPVVCSELPRTLGSMG